MYTVINTTQQVNYSKLVTILYTQSLPIYFYLINK